MAKFPNRIREIRESLEMSQDKLAEAIGTSPQQISRLEKGDRRLTDNWMYRLAPALHCAPDELLKMKVQLEKPTTPTRLVPLVSWVEAGKLLETSAVDIGDIRGTVPVTSNRKTLVALEVRGDSMNLIAPDKSVIIVDYENRTPIDRKYYVFQEGTELGFKQYRCTHGPERFEPQSTDSSHETYFPNGEVQILGRVIKVVKDLE